MTADPQEAINFVVAWSGAKADVRMPASIYAAYRQAIDGTDEISVKRNTQLQRYFTEFCDNDDYHRRLSDQKFKKEGNFSTGVADKKVAIFEFKAWQWRLYGAIMTVNKRRAFVGVVIDPNKKKDKADRAKLVQAAKLIGELKA